MMTVISITYGRSIRYVMDSRNGPMAISSSYVTVAGYGQSGSSLEFNETILDHAVLSTGGLECEPAIRSLEDVHPQIMAQERRHGEADGHSADSPWVTMSHREGCRSRTERHRAQPVEERGLKATAPGSFHAEVVVAVIPGNSRIAARHPLVDRHLIGCNQRGCFTRGERVVGEFGPYGLGCGAEQDRRPPLFRHEGITSYRPCRSC